MALKALNDSMKCKGCGMIENLPLIIRIASFESVSLLALFVIANMSEATREEFLRVLREQIARAQGRARFAALRDLEERRLVNEQLVEKLSQMERTITTVLRGDVEDVLSTGGLEDLVRMSVDLCAGGAPPPGSLL